MAKAIKSNSIFKGLPNRGAFIHKRPDEKYITGKIMAKKRDINVMALPIATGQ
jgi:hypothetical protein